MERLMRLVVAQGETIQTQLRRLNQRESQIESYEQQMHLLRVQSLGNDYLLSSYLHDQHHQPQEYPHVQHNPGQGLDADSGSRLTNHRNPLIPATRLQNNPQNNNHAPFSQSNKGLLPGMTDTREVHAKPINVVGDPNDLFIHDGLSKNDRLNSMRSTKFTEPFKNNGRFNSSNKDDTISEEKSNDSGVVLAEECLTLVEDRSRDFEDLNEAEVQERLTFFTKMEKILSRLLEEEEKIHGLKSTIEVIQTQQKREKSELEFDLKRAAEDHAALVADVRSNEQQIRVVDTSAVQKKKLIDALLADEVDSDQETKYLQAKLDYILHLPPTAFRLPEEGDDPPPLPPPPVHPSCLVQGLLHNQPPQLVHSLPVTCQYSSSNRNIEFQHQDVKTQTLQNNYSHCRSLSGDNRSSHGPVHGSPSPNILYSNRAPSPSIMMGSNRAPSPAIRLPNRSCSPNRRKPLHPPPYDHHKLRSGNLTSTDSSSVPVLRNSAISIRNVSVQSQVNNIKISNTCNSLKNTFPSVGVLPNKSDLRISNNRTVKAPEKHLHQASHSGKESNSLNQRTDFISTNKQGEENESDIPPPLPLSPPPLLTSPTSTCNLTLSKTSRTQGSKNKTKNPDLIDNEASKRNLLNSIGSHIVSGHSNGNIDDDNDSTTNNSSLGVSSRSSTSSETSISNCSSSVSSGVCVDTYHSNNVNKMHRIHNQISAVITKPSKLRPPTLVPGTNKPVPGDPIHLRTSTLPPNESKKETDSGDSNSDTGLSSLHSSSDEAGYALDTLV
ncbi:hypothetical protein FHG87_000844 [Trinorchestia longiramus]|nr:hypothetical protein FHG87_000844 [Trinorchestia longiramus]